MSVIFWLLTNQLTLMRGHQMRSRWNFLHFSQSPAKNHSLDRPPLPSVTGSSGWGVCCHGDPSINFKCCTQDWSRSRTLAGASTFVCGYWVELGSDAWAKHILCFKFVSFIFCRSASPLRYCGWQIIHFRSESVFMFLMLVCVCTIICGQIQVFFYAFLTFSLLQDPFFSIRA